MQLKKQYLDLFEDQKDFPQIKTYLEKYWLNIEEYGQKWKKIHHEVFDDLSVWKGRVFKKDFTVRFQILAPLVRESFLKPLRACLKEIGDEEFVVIQDYDPYNPPMVGTRDSEEPTLPHRFKFPNSITEKEARSGGQFSMSAFDFFRYDYFLFSECGKWGCYYLGDTEYPVLVIGYDPDYEKIFDALYEEDDEEKAPILRSLPRNYILGDEFKKNWQWVKFKK